MLVVAIGVGAWMFWPARTSSPTATAPHGEAPIAAQAGAQEKPSEAGSSNTAASGSPSASAEAPHAPLPTAQAGLKPLTSEDERRLQAFVDSGAQHNADQRDYELLVVKEAPDAEWSEATERRLEDALRRHGARFTALHASAPHCTRTLCRMLATGGFNSDAPDADWQRLVYEVQRDPSVRDAFVDQHTAVGGDDKGVMFVTYLVRRDGQAQERPYLTR
ncbi:MULTISPECIES: hypothetical protein [Lysobacteraceae]|uniref:hypothetical protein n=1 Tax=Lysobacteraceae TaxID=32033 RepID=UPI001BD16F0F|nr:MULTISPECIES: hypothetical protein [Lysobacter]